MSPRDLPAIWRDHAGALDALVWDGPDELFMLVDATDVIVAARGALSALGRTADALVGEALSTFEPLEGVGATAMPFSTALVESPGKFSEVAVRRPDERLAVVALRVGVVAEGLRLLRMVDVAAQHALGAETRRLSADLQRAFLFVTEQQRALDEARRAASLSAFAAGLAHELNNPLAIMSSNANAMVDYVDDVLAQWPKGTPATAELAELPDIAKTLRDTSGRIANIVRCLKELEAPSRREVVDVAALVKGLADDSPPTVVEGPATLMMLSDRAALIRLLRPLLDNARRAVGPQGVVRVSLAVEGERVALAVCDDGPGVPADLVARVFDPFFTTRPPGQGLGLGLFLARRAANVLGGDLSLTALPTGTRLDARLPRELPEREAHAPGYEALRTGRGPGFAPPVAAAVVGSTRPG